MYQDAGAALVSTVGEARRGQGSPSAGLGSGGGGQSGAIAFLGERPGSTRIDAFTSAQPTFLYDRSAPVASVAEVSHLRRTLGRLDAPAFVITAVVVLDTIGPVAVGGAPGVPLARPDGRLLPLPIGARDG